MSLDPAIRQSLALPAMCAPMSHVSGPELVREACKAGIMAGLPRHNAKSIEEFEKWLLEIREDLEAFAGRHPKAIVGPLAVNLARSRDPSQTRNELALCAKYGVKVIISALGDPSVLTKIVHDWGGKVFHDATSMRFAEKAIEAGVDGITCIGSGGGGHSGLLSPLTFVPKVRSIFNGTIILAGAISTGSAIRAAEVLGADIAYLGTRFIASRESSAPDPYKEMLRNEEAAGLLYTEKVSGVPANWLKASLRMNGLDPDDLPSSSARGNYDHLPEGVRPWREIWSAGQGIELIDDIPTVAEIVKRLKLEYDAACSTPSFDRVMT